MDVTNKISKIEIAERSFTPEGETKPINYLVLACTVSINGTEKVIDFKATGMRDKATILELADEN